MQTMPAEKASSFDFSRNSYVQLGQNTQGGSPESMIADANLGLLTHLRYEGVEATVSKALCRAGGPVGSGSPRANKVG
jgi:hypothetical protein